MCLSTRATRSNQVTHLPARLGCGSSTTCNNRHFPSFSRRPLASVVPPPPPPHLSYRNGMLSSKTPYHMAQHLATCLPLSGPTPTLVLLCIPCRAHTCGCSQQVWGGYPLLHPSQRLDYFHTRSLHSSRTIEDHSFGPSWSLVAYKGRESFILSLQGLRPGLAHRTPARISMKKGERLHPSRVVGRGADCVMMHYGAQCCKGGGASGW
mmetsp:Transcript_131280/g.227251  ORF Transcript_131280/g.227251 Transcript_131280/m.227251 type:complete len:208 (+) Transcript_131280:372-995(+)